MGKAKQFDMENGDKTSGIPPTMAGLSSKGIYEILDMYKGDISRLLSNPRNADRVISIFTNIVRRNLKLMECETETMIGGIMRSVVLGLDPNPELGECYFIPRKNNKRGGVMECNFEIGYKGYISMASNTGEIHSVSARVVRENDFFDYEYGLVEKCVHKPGFKNKEKGDLTHCYCVWRFRNGGVFFDVMDADEVEAVRNVSQAKDSKFSPWNVEDWVPDMWRKSVVKRSRKYVPLSSERIKRFVREMSIDDVVHTPQDFRPGEWLDPTLLTDESESRAKVPETASQELRDTKTAGEQTSLGDVNAQPPGD